MRLICLLIVYLVLSVLPLVQVNNTEAAETLLFGVGEWVPFIGENLDKYGPAAEIVALACERAGYQAKFQFSPWNRALELTKNGTYVATFPWSRTPEREATLSYMPTPIFSSEEYLFYLKEKFPEGIHATTITALRPYDVVGVRGYWYDEAAAKAGIDIYLVKNDVQALKMIYAGRKDVYSENPLVAWNIIKTHLPDAIDAFTHSEKPIRNQELFLLFSRVYPDSKETMAKINQAMAELKAQGMIDKIMNN